MKERNIRPKRRLDHRSRFLRFSKVGNSVRATGSLHWLHTVSTRWLTWYFAHQRRGREAMNAADILPNFRGRAVDALVDVCRIRGSVRSSLGYAGERGFCSRKWT